MPTTAINATNIEPRFPIKESQLSNDILVNYVLSAIGICTTLFRLWDRVYHHRFWHDDIAAIVCMSFQIMFLILGSLYMEDPVGQSPKLRVALHVMALILIQALTWSSKLILSLNLLRIVNHHQKLRRFLIILSFVFAAGWPFITLLNIGLCVNQHSWYDVPQPTCIPGLAFVIVELTTNVLADFILTTVPIWYIWRSGLALERAYRIRMTAIFLTFALMTADIINHEYWTIKDKRPQEELSSVLHADLLLIIANMVVIIPFLFRMVGSKEHGRLVLRKGSSDIDDSDKFPCPIVAGQAFQLERVGGIQIELNVTTEYDIHYGMERKELDTEMP